MHFVNLINTIDHVFLSHAYLHPQIRAFVYMYALSPTTCALQIALYIPHTYYYQHMSFPTILQHKKTQLIINSSINIRFDWFSLIIFSLHNRSWLLMLFCYFCNRPTQFSFLFFSYSKEIDPIYLFTPWFTYSLSDLIASYLLDD
jgi:hypothetical protein